MARSILSFGMLWLRAVWMALRRRGLPVGSPPPILAAMLISFDNLLKMLPRLTSSAPLKRLTFDHLLCPAMEPGKYVKISTRRTDLVHECIGTGTPRKRRLSRRQSNLRSQSHGPKFVNRIREAATNGQPQQTQEFQPQINTDLH